MFYIYYLFTVFIYLLALALLPLWLPISLCSRRHRLLFLRFLPFLAPLFHPQHARAQAADWHFHFASFGEANALAPLLAALQERGETLLLTCSSRTGLARAREICPNAFLLPLEPLLPLWLPRCGHLVVFEAELYWGLVRAYAGRSLLLDARMKRRSVRRYLRARWLYSRVFGSFGAIWAQSAADARRLAFFGARASVSLPLKLRAAPRAGCALPPANALLLASTHEGEEELILAALEAELEANPPAVIIIAPRHPERFEAVWALLQRRFEGVARYSEQPLGYLHARVFLLDALGRLEDFYAICERVVLGGSFAPIGGHNFAEPAAHAARIASGPHVGAQRAVLAHIRGVKICAPGEQIDFSRVPRAQLERGSLNELLINLKKEVNETRKSL